MDEEGKNTTQSSVIRASFVPFTVFFADPSLTIQLSNLQQLIRQTLSLSTKTSTAEDLIRVN